MNLRNFTLVILRNFTVDLLILARYRDRTVSVTKLWPQISHPYHTLSTVP